MKYQINKSHRVFGGQLNFAEHSSDVTKTQMRFSFFMPPSQKPKKALIWLSGLTCTEENFMAKAGAFKTLANLDAMVICPDTSPRGLELKGEHESYDFGSGAGFYLNAKTEGYADHYRMYDYIKLEVPAILETLGIEQMALSGHSMGGLGALVLGLRESSLFSTVSAFSPIVNPIQCPWGQKAFAGYLGENLLAEWSQYDPTELVKSGLRRNCIMIDQGLKDEFFKTQLMSETFETACAQKGQELKLRYQEGYDHSYYFVSTFIEDHLQFHFSS